jgi:hypothetical protein
LAEVVGWLTYDVEEHDLWRRMNQESLYFVRGYERVFDAPEPDGIVFDAPEPDGIVATALISARLALEHGDGIADAAQQPQDPGFVDHELPGHRLGDEGGRPHYATALAAGR